ncbi:PREDICTED: S-acyl fatty acid synthase thioesterase, medium chain [Elephantulus edwardii]|uniref:S-acyl fatty acid synthase thioesterase, medium chain n=1 Tax=Elephantulus edwardii TaxID=28737 RepID=UPI0003F0EFDD|nr:PREDICTED: S-acyl fatty acid synthase thioesterase, medium chain [Elephantulus edwardii]
MDFQEGLPCFYQRPPWNMLAPDQVSTTDNLLLSTKNEKVVNCLHKNPKAVFRLICFPWAGSGSIYFAKWGQTFHDSVEVYSIRLAGRESRWEEPVASDMHHIAAEIACALLPVLQDKPFAFFGHSMGSYIALMTALLLKEKHKLEPMHFFISGTTPPHSKSRHRLAEIENLTEDQIIRALVDFGSTTKNASDSRESLHEYSPVLLADIRMTCNYFFDTPSEAVLSCDITCFVGSEDKIVQDVEAWRDITSGNMDIHRLPGHHFYLTEPSNENFIKKYITKCLELSALSC